MAEKVDGTIYLSGNICVALDMVEAAMESGFGLKIKREFIQIRAEPVFSIKYGEKKGTTHFLLAQIIHIRTLLKNHNGNNRKIVCDCLIRSFGNGVWEPVGIVIDGKRVFRFTTTERKIIMT